MPMNVMKRRTTFHAQRTEPAVTVHVQIASRAADIPAARHIRRWARAALAGRRSQAEVTVRVVGENEGRQLNKRWRNRPQATNVLSFPAAHLALSPGALGDIAVCAAVVKREAKSMGKPLAAHWAHLIIHGVLHLTGHDHVRRRDAVAMEALEARILARLGIPDPYLVEKT